AFPQLRMGSRDVLDRTRHDSNTSLGPGRVRDAGNRGSDRHHWALRAGGLVPVADSATCAGSPPAASRQASLPRAASARRPRQPLEQAPTPVATWTASSSTSTAVTV